MKKLLLAVLLIVPSLTFAKEEFPIRANATRSERTQCDYEFHRFGRQYCVIKPKGRRGSQEFQPGSITATVITEPDRSRFIQVIKPTQKNKYYRPRADIMDDRHLTSRQRKERAYEEYQRRLRNIAERAGR